MTKRGSLVLTLLMAVSACFLLDTFTAPPVMAATGEVIWVNPPENTGKIKRDDDDDGDDYTYNTSAGDTNPPDYTPSVGDKVTFTPGEGHHATDVTIIDDPPIPPGGDPSASSAIGPASAALGLLVVGGLYGVRRRSRD